MTYDFQADGIQVDGHGEQKALCPQCSHTRKKSTQKCLNVNVDTGVWHCWHCDWSGKAKDLDAAREAQVARVVRDRPKAYVKPALEFAGLNVSATNWLKSRGITAAVAERNRLTVAKVFMPQIGAEVASIAFPYLRGGEVVNVKYRDADKHFRSVSGAERLLYGFDDIASTTVIVEGEMDKLACEVAGFRACVSVPDGAPAPGTKNIESKFDFLNDLPEVERWIIAVDNDAPGQRLQDELVRRFGPERCMVVSWPDGCKDANDTLLEHGAAGLAKCIKAAAPIPIVGVFGADDFGDEFERMYDEGMPSGLSTGWDCVDEHMRVQPGQLLVVTGIPGHGKALALDTPIPSPYGWTDMGALERGDIVYDENGEFCWVLRATEVMHNRECYRLTFSDGSTIVCDADHQWVTRDDKARRSIFAAAKRAGPVLPRGSDQSSKRSYPSAKLTKDIAATLRAENGKRANHSVRVCSPLSGDVGGEVPIDPYVLGVWLGDGSSYNASVHTVDEEVLSGISSAGHPVKKWTHGIQHGVAGLHPLLKAMGLLQHKRIPLAYQRLDPTRRLRLLQGLMDTDGCIDAAGRCEFTSTLKELADGVHDLVAGLGMVPTTITGRATLYGKDCGEKFRVCFTPKMSVFTIKRKLERIKDVVRDTNNWRYIVSCERVASVPVRCIEVSSPTHQFLCGKGLIPTHNSEWVDALTVNMALYHGWRTAFYSPENYPIRLHMMKLAEKYIEKPYNEGPHPRMTAAEVSKARDWMQAHYRWLMPESPSLDEILDKARALVFRDGIRCLVIDPWNEVEHNRPSGTTEAEYVSESLRKLRLFARKHEVLVIVVAHPRLLEKRSDGKYPVPTPYDISGGANWRNKADNCVAVYADPTDPRGGVEIHIQKVKFKLFGQVGMVLMTWDRVTGRYFPRWP